jgi:hypothetical protein
MTMKPVTKPVPQPDYTANVRRRLADAIQTVARRTSNPRIRIAIDARGDYYHTEVVVVCGVGYATVPVDVKHSYSTAVGPATRNGKVTISVHSGDYAMYTKTCALWTDERLAEAAEYAWSAFDFNQKGAAAQVRRLEARQEYERMATHFNAVYNIPNVRLDGRNAVGLRLDADLTRWEAKAVLDVLKLMRTPVEVLFPPEQEKQS